MSTKGKVKVNIPKLRTGEPDVFVGVNGKTIQIQRGKDVMIDQEFAEVLKHSQKSDRIAMEFIEQLEASNT